MASYGVVSSDEVAEDYRRALEDLTMNSRYEISNLTVIAKENTEHAMAISDALKAHIKAVRSIPLSRRINIVTCFMSRARYQSSWSHIY